MPTLQASHVSKILEANADVSIEVVDIEQYPLLAVHGKLDSIPLTPAKTTPPKKKSPEPGSPTKALEVPKRDLKQDEVLPSTPDFKILPQEKSSSESSGSDSDSEKKEELASQIEVTKPKELVLGDVHGNALGLLHFLIHENLLDVPEEVKLTEKSNKEINKAISDPTLQKKLAIYNKFVELYNKYNKPKAQLTPKDKQDFDAIIDNARIINPARLILIGDLVKERGANDYFTLKIVERLATQKKDEPKVDLEILLSNHDMEFFRFYEKTAMNEPYNHNNNKQSTSLENLKLCFNNYRLGTKDQQQAKIKSIIEKCYKPNLKLISYSISDSTNTISLFTHAPVGLETVKALAKDLGVTYADTTMQQLAYTIEQINEKYKTEYIDKGKIYDSAKFDEINNAGIDYGKDEIPTKFSIIRLIWLRTLANVIWPKNQNGYNINYNHGHNNAGFVERAFSGFVNNLDNILGKVFTRDQVVKFNKKCADADKLQPMPEMDGGTNNHKGEYRILRRYEGRQLTDKERAEVKEQLEKPAALDDARIVSDDDLQTIYRHADYYLRSCQSKGFNLFRNKKLTHMKSKLMSAFKECVENSNKELDAIKNYAHAIEMLNFALEELPSKQYADLLPSELKYFFTSIIENWKHKDLNKSYAMTAEFAGSAFKDFVFNKLKDLREREEKNQSCCIEKGFGALYLMGRGRFSHALLNIDKTLSKPARPGIQAVI